MNLRLTADKVNHPEKYRLPAFHPERSFVPCGCTDLLNVRYRPNADLRLQLLGDIFSDRPSVAGRRGTPGLGR
jgi:hypothetical protein